MCGVGQVRRYPRPDRFRRAATRKSIGVGSALHHLSRSVGKNGRVAKAGNPRRAVFINQDICLKYKVDVNFA